VCRLRKQCYPISRPFSNFVSLKSGVEQEKCHIASCEIERTDIETLNLLEREGQRRDSVTSSWNETTPPVIEIDCGHDSKKALISFASGDGLTDGCTECFTGDSYGRK
jgi:hypothetical protein